MELMTHLILFTAFKYFDLTYMLAQMHRASVVVVNNVSNKGKAFLYENLKEAVSLIIAVFKQTRLKKSMQPRHVKSLCSCRNG